MKRYDIFKIGFLICFLSFVLYLNAIEHFDNRWSQYYDETRQNFQDPKRKHLQYAKDAPWQQTNPNLKREDNFRKGENKIVDDDPDELVMRARYFRDDSNFITEVGFDINPPTPIPTTMAPYIHRRHDVTTTPPVGATTTSPSFQVITPPSGASPPLSGNLGMAMATSPPPTMTTTPMNK